MLMEPKSDWAPPRGGPWKWCCLPNGGSHRLKLIGTTVFVEDGPRLRARWPVLF